MKVLFVSFYCPFDSVTGAIAAGAEMAMRSISESLAARGHAVHYLSFCDQRHEDVLVNGVHLHLRPAEHARPDSYTPSTERVIAGLSKLESRSKKGKGALGGKLLPHVTQLRGRLSRHAWMYKQVLTELVREHQIDLIHCFSSLPDSLACAIVADRFNIPMVMRIGGRYWYLKYQSFKSDAARSAYLDEIRYAFSRTACFAYNSEFIRNETRTMFEQIAFQPTSTEVVLDIGVVLPPLTAAGVAQLDEKLPAADIPLVACVGKFKKHSKRQDLLLHALKHSTCIKPWHVVFAGGGPELEAHRALAEELGVADRAHFLGALTREEVLALLKRATIFAHPTEFEGSSKALAEAMLCGKPIVASAIPANAELVQDGINGFLAQNAPEDFTAKIDRLLDSSELRERYAAKAIQQRKRFDVRQNALRYERLFKRLIAEKRGVRSVTRVEGRRVVFVAGAQRSGTTLIQTLLENLLPAATRLPEAHLVTDLFERYEQRLAEWEKTGAFFSSQEAFEAYYRDSFQRLLADIERTSSPRSHVVLKDPSLARFFPTLADVLPDAGKVLVVRDPRDVLASFIKIGQRDEHRGVGSKYSTRDIDPVLKKIVATYRPYLDHQQTLSDVVIVRYEAVCQEPEATMCEVFQALRLPAPRWPVELQWLPEGQRHLNRTWITDLEGKAPSAEHVGDFRSVLTVDEIRRTERICGEVMAAFGYPPESTSAKRIAVAGA
ncbi:MAG: glycosyltransferase [Bdellovibrionales bacterium]|nr:glycosyltransferase [Bdellovibrionales bacterium]